MQFATATAFAFTLATFGVNANFQSSQVQIINDALNQFITNNVQHTGMEGCSDPKPVAIHASCGSSVNATIPVGAHPMADIIALLGPNNPLQQLTVKEGYTATLRNAANQYIIVDHTEAKCFADLIEGGIQSIVISQHKKCDAQISDAQNDHVVVKTPYKLHPLFGAGADNDSPIINEAMITVTQAQQSSVQVPLMGDAGSWHPLLEEGAVNCIDENGNDQGFHCLMEPMANTPNNDQLRKNENANLCASEQNGDQVHCHASDTSDMYRYVMVDHINRNYNGKLDCKCGSPAGYVSDCDITTKNDVARYESGKNNCNTGYKDRSGSDRWIISDWGNRYMSKDDKAQQAYYAVDLGLNDNRRRSAVLSEKVEYQVISGVCKRVTTQYNSKVGAKTTMAKKVEMRLCQ